mgnify:FL=1
MISSPALAKELKLRWDKIQQNMSDVHADGLLICDNVNLYYVSGRIFRGYCYIPVKGEPIFFVRRPLGLNGTQVVYIRKPEEIGEYLQKNGIAFPDKLLLESDSISYSDYKRYETIFIPKEVLNGTDLLRRCRSIKTPYEIDLIRRSGELHAKAYETIPSLYRKGMTDVEFSIELEHECRKLGSLGIFRIFGQSMEIFMGSVLAGDNADTPSPYDFAMGGAGLDVSLPVGCNGTVLTEGMSLMVDMGGNFTGYMTDMTRTYAIGSVQELALKAHETSIAIHQAIAAKSRPGVAAKDLYELAAEMANDARLSDYFMGHRQKAGFIGHGVGIEINEAPVLAPRSRDILAEGMVFALEPKFVIPGTGALGIENTDAVTADGVEKLTVCKEELISLQ